MEGDRTWRSDRRHLVQVDPKFPLVVYKVIDSMFYKEMMSIESFGPVLIMTFSLRGAHVCMCVCVCVWGGGGGGNPNICSDSAELCYCALSIFVYSRLHLHQLSGPSTMICTMFMMLNLLIIINIIIGAPKTAMDLNCVIFFYLLKFIYWDETWYVSFRHCI